MERIEIRQKKKQMKKVPEWRMKGKKEAKKKKSAAGMV